MSNPLQSTLQDLTPAKLNMYLAANLPVAPSVDIPTFDGNDSGAYIKAINLRQGIFEVYGGTGPDPIFGFNQYQLQQFGFFVNEWYQHGKDPSKIPAWPVLGALDLAEFDTWWDSYNQVYDVRSPHYQDQDFQTSLAKNQYFKVKAPELPAVVILPAVVATAPISSNPVGAPVAGTAFFHVTSAAATYSVGQADPTGKYVLINPSPMNEDPLKFWWAPK